MADFSQNYRVRFAHCDAAGIVFFPQYLVMLNGFIEDWLTEGLGVDYYALFTGRRIGLPTVALECEFVRPSRMGEIVRFSVTLDKLGSRSIVLRLQCHCGDELRWTMHQTLVTLDLDAGKSTAMPDDLRNALAALPGGQPT